IDDIEVCVAAVDIGTTVVEAYFFSLPDYKLIKKAKTKNLQKQFGADVISRVTFAKDEDAINKLKQAAEDSIKELAGSLYDKVTNWVITGNTTMLYLFEGINPESIAQYPFKTETLFGYSRENIYLPPCISAYIGADVVAAILSSNMLNEEYPSMLVDIGTNGEIALFDGEKLHCASTSAGPALEGASISMGMTALKGAICKVDKDGNFETIEKEKPTGICASGLIDAVAYMLDTGVLKEDGYLDKPFEIPESSVFITPKDIREVQLAKSAICAGIETLLSVNKIDVSKLKTLYIAGALGNNADIENCKRIGLIPKIDSKKIKLLGNAALCGAVMILKNENLKEKTEEIVSKAQICELSLSDEFTSNYINNMSF
ncbi:MAG: DUF4445 domain-containing protein, partial [Clostridia bacterium]|nr:DUF4445 domain-containing protein [Clostridia bacterium]